MNKEIDPIQQAINNLLKGQTQIKKRKIKKVIQEKAIFIETIEAWKESLDREEFITNDTGIGIGEYNNLYYTIINNLVILKYGIDVYELIHFFVYNLDNPDGSKNSLKDQEGRIVKLDTAEDLWDLIQKIKSEAEEK